MREKIEKEVKNILSNILYINHKKISNKFSNDSVENWDSLKHINIVLALEEEFSIHFNNDDITLMNSYNSIVDIVEAKLKND